jgi:hypothetical protein
MHLRVIINGGISTSCVPNYQARRQDPHANEDISTLNLGRACLATSR